MNQKKDIHQASKHLRMPGTNLKNIKLTTSNLKQPKAFYNKIKKSSAKINRSGSRASMTSKKELSVVVPNGYQPLNGR